MNELKKKVFEILNTPEYFPPGDALWIVMVATDYLFESNDIRPFIDDWFFEKTGRPK